MIRHMVHHSKGKSGTRYRKLYSYSAHDLTLTTILDTMGIYDVHQPDYASLLMIELKKNVTSNSYFVDVSVR